jgi:glycosyltransferase involved in cell wall biosynthesis
MVLVPGLEPEWAQSAVGAQTNGQPFVLALGTGDPKKGVDTLLRAWRDAGVSERMRLVLFGDSWKRSGRARVEASIRALQLENVEHLGCVTDEALRYLYRNATAFVFPSWFEGLGLPPAEYSHYGSGDLLLRDIPTLRELYGDVARFFSSEEELKVLLQRAAAPCSPPLMAPEQRLERLRERLDAANTFHRLYAAIMGECA